MPLIGCWGECTSEGAGVSVSLIGCWGECASDRVCEGECASDRVLG